MMLSIMIYGLVIACLLAACALVTERIFAELSWPRRGVWLAALLASLALPAYSVLEGLTTPEAAVESGGAPETAPEQTSPPTAARSATAPVEPRRIVVPRIQSLQLPSLGRSNWDAPLAVAWAAGAALILLAYCFAWLRLLRAARGWPAARVAGADVALSAGIGPAVFGFFRPRIVVPQWVAGESAPTQAMILRHEQEHVAAKDQLLLLAGLLAAAIAPWNLALWWQLRRLRLALEIDCDARVIRRGADAAAYSKALLLARQRRCAAPLSVMALTEPVSQLERRIDLLMRETSPLRRRLIAFSGLLAAILLAAACALDAPSVERRGNADADAVADADSVPDAVAVADADAVADAAAGQSTLLRRQPVTGLLLGGERIVVLVDVSASMLDRRPIAVEHGLSIEQQRTAPKWLQLIDTVDWLTAQIPSSARFQIIAFNYAARSLVPGTDGRWLDAADRSLFEKALQTLRDETLPAGPRSLHAAFDAATALEPAADNVYLLVDGLPTTADTAAEAAPAAATTDEERRELFAAAMDRRPTAPINTILMPMEDASLSLSAPSYWVLALQTGGSLVTPAEDWP